MNSRTALRCAGLVLAGLLLVLPAPCAETVILVRHAEKAAAPADNPPLTTEGRQDRKSTRLNSSH